MLSAKHNFNPLVQQCGSWEALLFRRFLSGPECTDDSGFAAMCVTHRSRSWMIAAAVLPDAAAQVAPILCWTKRLEGIESQPVGTGSTSGDKPVRMSNVELHKGRLTCTTGNDIPRRTQDWECPRGDLNHLDALAEWPVRFAISTLSLSGGLSCTPGCCRLGAVLPYRCAAGGNR